MKKGFFRNCILMAFVMLCMTGLSMMTNNYVYAQAAKKVQADADAETAQIRLNAVSCKVGRGYWVDLRVINLMEGADIIWVSDDPEVATVDQQGRVTGVEAGETLIRAIIGERTLICKVSVHIAANTSTYYGNDVLHMIETSDVFVINLESAFLHWKELGYETNGVYAAGYSDRYVRIQGIDAQGEIIKSCLKKGNFYVEFPDAVSILITNATSKTTVNCYPIKPAIIRTAGDYTQKDLQWVRTKDGIMHAFFLIAMKQSSYSIDTIDFSGEDGCYSPSYVYQLEAYDEQTLNQYEPAAWRSIQILSVEEVQEDVTIDVKIHVGKVTTYYSKDHLKIYGIEGLKIDDSFFTQIQNMNQFVQSEGKNDYVWDDFIWNENLVIGYQDICGYLDGEVIQTGYLAADLSDPFMVYDTMYLIARNCYWYSKDDTRLLNLWYDGIATAWAKDAYLAYTKESSYEPNYLLKPDQLTKEERKNPEYYFLEDNFTYADSRTVGYSFVYFLQEKYGKEIVKKIMNEYQDMLQNEIVQSQDDAEENSSKRFNLGEAKKESATLLTAVIKKCTVEEIFQQFVQYYE